MREGQFSTAMRIHLGLTVTDLEASVRFYELLFGEPPIKRREGYAKFEPEDPSVNLSLNEVSERVPHHPDSHFGIQVKSSEAVSAAIARLREAGQEVEVEESTACCYAVQDKVWVRDPEGHRWEIFVVTDTDSPHRAPTPVEAKEAAAEQAQAQPKTSCCG